MRFDITDDLSLAKHAVITTSFPTSRPSFRNLSPIYRIQSQQSYSLYTLISIVSFTIDDLNEYESPSNLKLRPFERFSSVEIRSAQPRKEGIDHLDRGQGDISSGRAHRSKRQRESASSSREDPDTNSLVYDPVTRCPPQVAAPEEGW